MQDPHNSSTRRGGSVLLVALILLTLMGALVAASAIVHQKNLQQSADFLVRSDLHGYAEAGIALAVHDLRFNHSGHSGNIGTENWTVLDDVGRDGIAGTLDEGEGDDAPTPGEPNVIPMPVGPTGIGTGVTAHVFDTGYTNLQRVVATSVRGDTVVTVEHFVRKKVVKIPKVAAVFVDPELLLDLKGNAFTVNGNDTNPDGTSGAEAPRHGLATATGDPPGDNKADLLAQIPSTQYDKLMGAGGEPSVGEVEPVDVQGVFSDLKGAMTHEVPPGTYDEDSFGNLADDIRVTYVPGNLHLTGENEGAGALLVEGSLIMSGSFTFNGIVIALGDVSMTGGGSTIHVWGSLMVGQSINAIDSSEIKVTGQADVVYSSAVLDKVQQFLADRAAYGSIMYDEK